MFFDGLSSSAFALTNKDDRNGQVMLQNTLASCHTYSLLSDSEFKCKILENSFNGLHLQLDGQDVWTLMLGAFNSYNLTAVYGASVLLGQNKAEVLTALSTLTPPQGRFQYYRFNKKIIGIIDYAHTPDALINVLQTIQNIKEENQEIITVIGCGGNRDKSKRPEMGKIAAKMSHKVIFTSDNPRNESPEEIIQEMNKGVEITERKKVLNITDRREAIKTAVSLAKTGSILMIAGKGHENYQEINGEKYPFNDAEILIETFNMQNQ
jgi:UDP-N-acetylmuramoyl-L-alanyl-D-glutamate--2,6-diaminopimelate ligase